MEHITAEHKSLPIIQMMQNKHVITRITYMSETGIRHVVKPCQAESLFDKPYVKVEKDIDFTYFFDQKVDAAPGHRGKVKNITVCEIGVNNNFIPMHYVLGVKDLDPLTKEYTDTLRLIESYDTLPMSEPNGDDDSGEAKPDIFLPPDKQIILPGQ